MCTYSVNSSSHSKPSLNNLGYLNFTLKYIQKPTKSIKILRRLWLGAWKYLFSHQGKVAATCSNINFSGSPHARFFAFLFGAKSKIQYNKYRVSAFCKKANNIQSQGDERLSEFNTHLYHPRCGFMILCIQSSRSWIGLGFFMPYDWRT